MLMGLKCPKLTLIKITFALYAPIFLTVVPEYATGGSVPLCNTGSCNVLLDETAPIPPTALHEKMHLEKTVACNAVEPRDKPFDKENIAQPTHWIRPRWPQLQVPGRPDKPKLSILPLKAPQITSTCSNEFWQLR